MNIQLNSIGDKIIIDIRSESQYLSGHIPGSINIVENKLLLMPEQYLDKDKKYVIYCDHGYRSYKVSNYLVSKGYNVYTLDGGYQSYLQM